LVMIMTLLLEYGIILLLTSNNIKNSYDLFKLVVWVNLITFPITQWLVLIFYSTSLIYSDFILFIYLLIEIVPITLEFLFYRYIFKQFDKDLLILKPISTKKTFSYSLSTNIISFLIISPFSIIHIIPTG
ncbi:MAG: hypothetical protein ACFE9J_14940, partial [Candidatus Hermodarchaeota archaeon]